MLEEYQDKIEEFVDSHKPLILEGIELIKELIEDYNQGPDSNLDLKLVVFIDDLDRCTPEKTTEIFESIKYFSTLQELFLYWD